VLFFLFAEFVFSKIKKFANSQTSDCAITRLLCKTTTAFFQNRDLNMSSTTLAPGTRAEGEKGTGHAIRWTRNCGVFESFV